MFVSLNTIPANSPAMVLEGSFYLRMVQGSVKSWENVSRWGASRTTFQARLSQGHSCRNVGTFLWDAKELRKQETPLSLGEIAELGPFQTSWFNISTLSDAHFHSDKDKHFHHFLHVPTKHISSRYVSEQNGISVCTQEFSKGQDRCEVRAKAAKG